MGQGTDAVEPATMHAELRGPVPRNVRMTGTGWANVVVLMVIFGLAVAWLVFKGNAALHASAKRNTLRADAGETMGQITRDWTSDRNSTQNISYAFEVNGTIYSGASTVPGSIWKGLKHAGGVNIKYSLADPRINHPADWEDSTLGMWWSFFPSVMISLVGFVLARELRTQRRLVAQGLPAMARVTECLKGRNGPFRRYEFRTEGGEIVRGGCSGGNKQDVGSTILVVYLPDNPGGSRTYPLETFRVDQ